MISRAQGLLIAIAALLITATTPLAAVEGISPGETDRLVQTPTACPGFSWEMDLEASKYELAVYSINNEQGGDALASDPAYSKALYKQISG
jgi:hypothetical protein